MLTVHSCLHPLHFSFKYSQKSRVNRIQKVLTLTNMMLFKLYEKHTVWSVMWSSFNKLFPITQHDVHISITRMLHDCLLYLHNIHALQPWSSSITWCPVSFACSWWCAAICCWSITVRPCVEYEKHLLHIIHVYLAWCLSFNSCVA